MFRLAETGNRESLGGDESSILRLVLQLVAEWISEERPQSEAMWWPQGISRNEPAYWQEYCPQPARPSWSAGGLTGIK